MRCAACSTPIPFNDIESGTVSRLNTFLTTPLFFEEASGGDFICADCQPQTTDESLALAACLNPQAD